MNYDKRVFDLLMARFDTLEAQNKAQLDLMVEHIKVDDTVHAIVTKHDVYWTFAKYIVTAIVTGSGSIAAWFGLSKH